MVFRGVPSDRSAFNASRLNALRAAGPPLHSARSKAPFSRAHLQLAGCRLLTCLHLRSLGSAFPTSRPGRGFILTAARTALACVGWKLCGQQLTVHPCGRTTQAGVVE